MKWVWNFQKFRKITVFARTFNKILPKNLFWKVKICWSFCCWSCYFYKWNFHFLDRRCTHQYAFACGFQFSFFFTQKWINLCLFRLIRCVHHEQEITKNFLIAVPTIEMNVWVINKAESWHFFCKSMHIMLYYSLHIFNKPIMHMQQ